MGNDKIRFGFGCAIGAQVAWGLFPIYVHFLKSHDDLAVVAHRILWSFVLLISLLWVARFVRSQHLPSLEEIRAGLKNRRTMVTCFFAALLIVTNWIVFIWAVLHEHKVDASLGYYICPQLVVILGVIFQRERLARIQWVGFALTSLGVLYMVRSSASMPLVSLTVAFAFGFYALLKKRVSLSALGGLTFESGFLFVPALIYLAFFCDFLPSSELAASAQPDGPTVFTRSWQLNVLLVGCGVATVVPLAMYATALKHIPLSTVGLLQFIGPTIQFLIGTFVYHETFDRSRLVGFVIVFAGVGIYLASMRSAFSVAKDP